MSCLQLVIDMGEGTPPIITSVIINGSETSINPTSLASITELTKELNKVQKGFLVSQNELTTIINYPKCDLDSVSITVDGDVTDFEEKDCECCKDCFTGLIGLKTVCDNQDCKLFLNDIGIDRRFIEQVITSDFKGVTEFFESQKRLAQKDISGMIHSYMMPKFYANSLIGEGKIGFVEGGYKTPLGTWQGIYFEMNDSDYLTYISQVGLSLSYSDEVLVCAFDLDENEMIYSEIIKSIAGATATAKTSILLNRNRIFLGFQPTGNHKNTLVSRNMCCGQKSRNCQSFKVSGAHGELESLKKSEYTGGLSVSYSISCDHESWICRNGQVLSLPMFYRTAQNIYQFALTHSKHNRINTVVAVNTEQLEASLAWATEKFNQSINDALKGLSVPSNRCFNCNEFARSVLSLP